MARNNRHNAAFVVGAIIGGLAGSAAALWKTPYSGDELRAKLAGGDPAAAGHKVDTGAPMTTSGQGRSIKDKVLSTVEQTLAPVVGVELGKTANDSGPLTPPVEVKQAPPEIVSEEVINQKWSGEPPERVREVVQDHHHTPGKGQHVETTDPAADDTAATIEELTKPQIHRVPDALQHEEIEMSPFPKLGGNEPGNT